MENRYLDACPLDMSDDDILKAMRNISGYLDITPGDFKEIYRFAYRHAVERIRSLLKAKDVMTTEIVFVKKETPLENVAEIMDRQGISGVPVIDDDNTVAGVISEKDFLFHMGDKKKQSFMGVVAHYLKSKGCVALSMHKQKAKDIMTSPAITVTEHTTVSEIANMLTQKNINRLPVTDPDRKLIGIVTRTDIVRASCFIGNVPNPNIS